MKAARVARLAPTDDLCENCPVIACFPKRKSAPHYNPFGIGPHRLSPTRAPTASKVAHTTHIAATNVAHAILRLSPLSGQKKSARETRALLNAGGEVGIRTLDALLGHTHLAGEHLRPLGHFSKAGRYVT